MKTSTIKCPKCGNPRCCLMHDASLGEGWWVWCPAPRCNINGPRETNAAAAIDRFIDETPRVTIERCPICGEKAFITIGWRNGHSDYIFSHERPSDGCPANRVIHFISEDEVRKWLKDVK